MTTSPITGETWGDEIEGPKAYIAEQSQRSLGELVGEFRAAHDALLTAVEGVNVSQAEFRPGAGNDEEDWGIAEVLRHIGAMDLIIGQRISQLGRGEPVNVQPTYPGFMESVETRNIAELRDILARSGELLVSSAQEIDGKERLDTTDAHRRFGDLNCRGWLVMHTLHLQDHARQVSKIKSTDGFPSAGG